VRPNLPQAPFLYAIVDAAFLRGRPVGSVVGELARGGAGLLQLRVKGETDRRFLELAKEAVLAAREAGVPLLVNDRADIARIVGADGIHLGQEDLTPDEARRLLPDGALLGLSTHGEKELEASAAEPLDYVAIGAVFPTSSKERPDPVVGLEGVRRARSLTKRPLVAIGGINMRNAREVVRAGADGLAVISALMGAEDVGGAARDLGAEMRRA